MGKNERYWQRRDYQQKEFRKLITENEESIKMLEYRLSQEYKKAYEDILLKDFAKLYSEFKADKENFTYTKKLKLKWINDYAKKLKEMAKELGVKEEELMTNKFEELYNKVAKKTNDKLGVNPSFNLLPKNQIKKVLETPWLGRNYRSTIWKDKDKLVDNLETTILRGLIQGKSFTDMTEDLRKVMHNGAYNCRRIIRTETMNVVNRSQMQGYKEAGVEYVRINGRDDGRACNSCISKFSNKQVFKIDEAPFLPTHANCRCSYIPVIEIPKEEKEQEIKDMTYEEYSNRFEAALNSFNKKFKGDKGVLKELVYEMPPKEREVFLNTFNDVVFKSRKGVSHYAVENGKGYISFDSQRYNMKDLTSKEFNVIFHEFGHYVHLDVAEKGIWAKTRKFDKLHEIVEKDREIIEDLLYKAKELDKQAIKELSQIEKILRQENNLSDIFGALTYNRFYGRGTHSMKYWSINKENRFDEIIANIYSIKARYGVDSEEYKIIEKFVPQTLKTYEKIINEALKGRG